MTHVVPPEYRDENELSHALGVYRTMCVIRRFEDRVQSLFTRGAVHGTTHLYQGQEAVASGVCDALAADDLVASTYRGHGHAIALGVDPQSLLDELLGRASGICGGLAGSMNVIDRKRGLIGCFGIVGGSIAAATGAGLALRDTGAVAVAFFGDGAVNQAYFSECLNFAKVFALPVLFVCENNLYGEFTPWEQVTAGEITARPQALGIPAETVDGNDVWGVSRAATGARARAAVGEGPQFIEALTYRFAGHSRTDPGHYRKPGELDQWLSRDPLITARARLETDFDASVGSLDAIEAEVKDYIDQITERALQAPFPKPDLVLHQYMETPTRD